MPNPAFLCFLFCRASIRQIVYKDTAEEAVPDRGHIHAHGERFLPQSISRKMYGEGRNDGAICWISACTTWPSLGSYSYLLFMLRILSLPMHPTIGIHPYVAYLFSSASNTLLPYYYLACLGPTVKKIHIRSDSIRKGDLFFNGIKSGS